MSSSIRTSGPAGIPPHGHATEREVLRESVKHDYATEKSGGIVPLDRRRRLWSMAALWLTMNCGFGEIFIGFEYHQAGFTLLKSVAVSLIGCALYFCYAVPAAYLGTRTGQTHSLLARSVFGRVGAVVVATCLLVMGTGFVGFQSSITAQIFDGLFSWGHLLLVGIAVSIFCILNNVLGFSGVVAWARYVVTPIVVLWIVYMMVKALATEPSSVLGAHPPVVAGLSVWQGIGAMLGVCVWGDEPDFWRFGKPRFWWPAVGYAFGLIVGDILFTLAGWVMAQLAGAGDFSHSVMYVTTYSLFGLTWLAFIVAGVSQMAAQDGNYYAAINALQGMFGEFRRWNRLYSCALAVGIGCLFTWFVTEGTTAWLDVVTFGSAAVPSATVIMLVDHYLVPRLLRLSRSLLTVPTWSTAGVANIPAIVAMIPAIVIGTFGAGSVPGFGGQYWWLPGPFSWLSAAVVYLAGMAVISRLPNALTLAGFSDAARASAVARTPAIEDLATVSEAGGLVAPEAVASEGLAR
jgi:purine-cytosine permease-like protein